MPPASITKKLLIIAPLVVALTLVSLFLPARQVTIEGIGRLSLETGVTLSVGLQTTYASPDVVTRSPSANSGGWTNPANAHADGSGYASVTSGTPSASHIYSGYGFNLTSNTINQVKVRYDAWCTGITYIGTSNSAANNPTSGSFSLPTGWTPGDVAIFWWYTYSNTKTFTAPAGVTQKQQAASAGYGRIYIGYRTLQSGDSTFSWTSGSVGNSTTIWGTSVFRNVDGSGDPFEAQSGAPATFTNDRHPDPPAVTTVSSNACVVAIFGKDNDYTSITPPTNYLSAGSNSSTAGSDASAGVAYRIVPSPGSEDPGAWTLGGGAVSDDGYVWTGALKPDSLEQIRVDVSWDGGESWSSKQITNLTVTEVTYWYDVTGATSWTPEKLNNANFRVRVDAYSVGSAGEVRLDWIPVEVSYEPLVCSPNISNAPNSHNFGTVSKNSAYETGLDRFAVTNNSGGAIDISIRGTDMTGGTPWTLSDTCTPGPNTYGLKAGLEGSGDYTIIVKKGAPFNNLVENLANGATQKWGLKLYTPTEFSDGYSKSGTVTLTATCR